MTAAPEAAADVAADVAVATHGLTMQFGGVRALDDVSLAVPRGQTRAVIGPNGAGKTTLFNLLSGHLVPTAGRVELLGRDVTGVSAALRSRAGVSRTFQLSNLFERLTARENVALAVAGDDPVSRRRFHLPLRWSPTVVAAADDWLERVDLAAVGDRRVDELGHGQQRVLEVAMAMAGNPRVLLLDEPTAGVARVDAERIVDLVAGLDPHLTVLVVEHDMAVAFALADEVTVLVDGAELLTAPPDVVRGHPDVVRAYLGGDAGSWDTTGEAPAPGAPRATARRDDDVGRHDA